MKEPKTVAGRVLAARPRFPEEDVAEILRGTEEVLRSGRLILGPRTEELEERFKAYTGAEHAVAVSSCTAALQIAFRFLALSGREVVVPTNNFPGVVSAVLYEGGAPVLSEMDAETLCMDVGDAIQRVTPRTTAIVVTHIAGLVCPEIDRLREACEGRGLFLIEDASHAHGASLAGRVAGSFGDVACFSFYPTKIMTTGTGGMLTTRHAELAAYARSVRHHGQGERRNEFVALGNDWCMSEISALIGLTQLERLEENVTHRNRVVEWYREGLASADYVTIPAYSAHFRHAYYKFPVLLREGIDARQFRQALESEYGIENGSVYDPPCHLQPVFRGLLPYGEGAFPVAEATLRRQVCPPVHSSLSVEEVTAVIQAMNRVAERCGR